MLEKNDTKKHKAPAYRKALDKLPLVKLFARSKHGHPNLLPPHDFRLLLRALRTENIAAAEESGYFDLVDFNGDIVEGEKLKNNAKSLEDKVRQDVGKDNIRTHPYPINYEDIETGKKIVDWVCKVIIDC